MQNNVKYWQRLWKSSSDSQWEFLETGSDCWRGDVRKNVIYKGESLGLWEGKRTVFVHVIKQHQRWSEKKTCREGAWSWDATWTVFSPHSSFLGTCMCMCYLWGIEKGEKCCCAPMLLAEKAVGGKDTLSVVKYDQWWDHNLLNNPLQPYCRSTLKSLKIWCSLVNFY